MLYDTPQRANVRVISLLTALATVIKEAITPSVWNYRMQYLLYVPPGLILRILYSPHNVSMCFLFFTEFRKNCDYFSIHY